MLAARNYERSSADELLHIDTKKLARFERPGHRVTDDRTPYKAPRRLADIAPLARGIYPDAHRRDGCERVCLLVGCVALLHYYKRIGVRIAQVMTDNGPAHKSRRFAKSCAVWVSATSAPAPARHPPMARQNASSRLCRANGPTPTESKFATPRRRIAALDAPLQLPSAPPGRFKRTVGLTPRVRREYCPENCSLCDHSRGHSCPHRVGRCHSRVA